MSEMRAIREDRQIKTTPRNKAPENLYLHIAAGIFLGFGGLAVVSMIVSALFFGALTGMVLR